MKESNSSVSSQIKDKGRPDYYITPTRDFTQYTRDSEEKYWSKDTKFDWSQDIKANLKNHLEKLDSTGLSKVTFMILPMLIENLATKTQQITNGHLPLDEDALKDIAETLPSDKKTIHEAIAILAPLNELQLSLSRLEDRLEILSSEMVDLEEQLRLGLFRQGTEVKNLETEGEKKIQMGEKSRLSNEIKQTEEEYADLSSRHTSESGRLKEQIRKDLETIEKQVLNDLATTKNFLNGILQTEQLPDNQEDLSQLKELILKRQLSGLKDIANHALVVEQSAIAPLTMGIIHYKRYREIQEALTTFINDEAKHSATFRRFLVDKLQAKEYISPKLIKGASRYMWLARFMPGAGLFMAVIVEAIGAASLEFFAKEEYMPDTLFRSICKTISEQDEKRHMDLCVEIYNELFRKGHGWERFRNKMILTKMMKSVYGDKTEDNQLIQAFRAFGVESETLYRHIMDQLSQQLTRVSVYVETDRLLEIIGRKG
ncbi:MAG: hypothetical protein Roseis2KO_04060 [Roseivirga sp.]